MTLHTLATGKWSQAITHVYLAVDNYVEHTSLPYTQCALVYASLEALLHESQLIDELVESSFSSDDESSVEGQLSTDGDLSAD